MSYANLVRLGGLAAVVGGTVFGVFGSLMGPQALALRAVAVLFLLSMIAVIGALHILHRGRENYRYQAGALFSAAALVGLALAVGGYILVDFVVSSEGLGTTLFFVGALVATLGIIGLSLISMVAGVLPRWGWTALMAGNPILGVSIILASYGAYFGVGSWLVATPWILVGLAVLLAQRRLTEQPARVH